MKHRCIGAPMRPNVGTGEVYRKELVRLIDEMNASLAYWLEARYKENPAGAVSMDESFVGTLKRTMRNLGKRWQDKFDEAAPKLAEHYAKRAADRSTKVLDGILRDAGMVVDFKMTPAMRVVMDATVIENVSLIRSIAAEHLADVEQLVLRSASQGRDLATMSTELREKFDVPKKRAAMIALNQNNKMTATVTRVRQKEAGIDRAIWVHSTAGRKPRPEHVAFSGHEYNVAKGAFLEGVWTWPGVEINCRCYSRPIIAGF